MIQITAFYTSVLALLLILLSYNVASKRRLLGIGTGDGENKKLLKAIRIHANFIEYVPIAIILMLILEINQGKAVILHLCGSLLVIARVVHYLGLTKTLGASIERLAGVVLTWCIIVLLAILNLYNSLLSFWL